MPRHIPEREPPRLVPDLGKILPISGLVPGYFLIPTRNWKFDPLAVKFGGRNFREQIGGEETRYPGMTYIVFPGNVGDDDGLAVIRQRLSRRT